MNVGSRSLEREGRSIPLGSKAFEVLVCLLAHAGKLVTRDELLKTVWPDSFVDENNLAQHIFALRKALGNHATSIKTISGRGYQFTETVTVEQAEDAPPPTAISDRPVSPAGGLTVQRTVERANLVVEETVSLRDAQSASSHLLAEPAHRSTRRISLYLLLAVALLAVGFFAGWKWFHPSAHGVYQRVVVADIANSTGDPTFDRTLKRALEINLDQSLYIGVMSDAEAVSTLRMMGHKSDEVLTPEIAREICQRDSRDVLLTGGIAPMVRAKPLDAVAALEPARPYELSSFDIPRQRGEAYLKAHQPKLAEDEFKKIVGHYGIDVLSPDIPLAHLELERACGSEGDKTNSRAEYEQFFALWKDADQDLPALKEAHREYTALRR